MRSEKWYSTFSNKPMSLHALKTSLASLTLLPGAPTKTRNPTKQSINEIVVIRLFLLVTKWLYKRASAEAETIRAELASLEQPAKTADAYIIISSFLEILSNVVNKHIEYVKIIQKAVVQ
ncbi:hypothetical protein NRC25_005026, partial [Salmonella enterica]|nr:hypothetical protein [Salmonella enterica]